MKHYDMLRGINLFAGTTCAFVLVVAFCVVLFGSDYSLYVASIAAVYAILLVGFNLAIGIGGQWVLSHPAFFGVGAYTTGYLVADRDMNLPLAILLGVVATALIALCAGPATWRVGGLYLKLVTFAFLPLAQYVFRSGSDITGGAAGLNVPRPGYLSARLLFVVATLIAFACVLLTWRFMRSHAGRSWIAIGDSQKAAASIGVNVRLQSLWIFVVSSALAGLAGGLYVMVVQYITPAAFGFNLLVILIGMLVVGGMASVGGTALAAVGLTLLFEYLRGIGSWYEITYGLVLLLALIASSRWRAPGTRGRSAIRGPSLRFGRSSGPRPLGAVGEEDRHILASLARRDVT